MQNRDATIYPAAADDVDYRVFTILLQCFSKLAVYIYIYIYRISDFSWTIAVCTPKARFPLPEFTARELWCIF